MDDDADGYVTREEFGRLYPRGAQIQPCVFCRRWLIAPSNTLPDCGEHVIDKGEFV
jgi:hypothetical protein